MIIMCVGSELRQDGVWGIVADAVLCFTGELHRRQAALRHL